MDNSKASTSMKLIPSVDSMEQVDWGWSSYENRQNQARRYYIFHGFIAVIALIQFSMTSYAASFSPLSDHVLVCTYLIDFFLVMDIVVTAYTNRQADLRSVELKHGVSKLERYIKSFFILDILALAPTELIVLTCSSKLPVTKFNVCVMTTLTRARLNRLLNGYKIFRFLSQLEAEVGSPFVAIRSAYYIFISWMLLHLTACIWYFIPCSDYTHVWADGPIHDYCSAPSWIYSGGSTATGGVTPPPGFFPFSDNNEYTALAPWPNNNVYAGIFDHGEGSSRYLVKILGGNDFVRINATVEQRYYYSLYWAITTMTSVGLGEIHAITTAEFVFVIFAQLIGMVILFGIIQGSITSMLTNFDANLFQYKHRISAILEHLQDQNQSTELVRHVRDFYNYLWRRSSGMSSAGLFDDLPFALRSEIAMELCGHIIDRSPLFQDLSASFLRMLSLKFRPMLALPKQIIMRKGELSDLMVYVQNGELEVLSDDENEVPLLLLRPGKLFGEINLITRMPRKYSIRAIAHCDLVVLCARDLMDCLQSYPEIAENLRNRAEQRTGTVQQRIQEGLLAIDDQEGLRRTKHQKELSSTMEEMQYETGISLRPLMASLKIDRPQETLKVSSSIEFFKIRDPMEEMVEYSMGTPRQRLRARISRIIRQFHAFSVDPDGLFYYFWERIIISMMIATFFLNTYVGFFQSYRSVLQIRDPRCPESLINTDPMDVELTRQMAGIFILTLDYVMDAFFIVDYGLKFITQIPTATGKIIDHHTMILTYMKTWGCYTDFLAIFPIEIFSLGTLTADKVCGYVTFLDYLGYLKANRIFRVLTLPQFFDYLSIDLGYTITSVRMVKFTLYIGMITQLCALALFRTACTSDGCEDSPIYVWTGQRAFPYILKVPDDMNPDGVNGTLSYRYTSSLYWAVTLMTTVGYGDIWPHNMLEQAVVNFVMITGTLTYGYCVAVLTATIANLDAPRTEFQSRLFGLISYMESAKLTDMIKKRVVESLALLWSVGRGEEIPGVKSMTADMPEHLMEEIEVDDLVHLVAGVPIFKNIEEHILKRLAPAVRRYLFPPEEFVIQTGDLIGELFVIRRGFCHRFHPDQSSTVIAVLHAGMYFGEIGFLFNQNEIVSVKTMTHCEVLTLSRAAFDEIAQQVQWLSHQINHISREKKYYDDLVNAAKNAKPYDVRRRKKKQYARLSVADEKRLRFKKDLKSVHVSWIARFLFRALLHDTIPMNSKRLIIWEVTRQAVCVVQFVLILVQAAFQFDGVAFFVILYALDVHALVDIYIKFHVQYINGQNVVVTHPFMTAKRYLRTNFWLDCFCVMPFELLVLIPVGMDMTSPGRIEITHWIMYCSLNRFLQIYRVPLAFSYLESNIKVETSSLFLAKYCTYFVLYITLITCLPLIVQCPPLYCALTEKSCYFKAVNESKTDFGIALDVDYSCDGFSDFHRPSRTSSHWHDISFETSSKHHRTKRDVPRELLVPYGYVNPDGYVDVDNSLNCTIESNYLSNAYITDANDSWSSIIASLYWAVTTTTTTGFGDIHANNQTEEVLFLLVMISGSLFYGYITACIAAAQANSDAPKARFFERVVAIKKYLQHEHLSSALQKRLVRYYQYLWLRTQGIDPPDLTAGLPPSLTGELTLQLYRKVIDQIGIFKGAPLGFKKMAASIIRPLYVMEGEYVTRIGDTGSDLFILHRGSVEVQYRSGEVSPTVIRSGRLLGEVAFLTNQKAITSFRAKENSDLFYLPKDDFDVVLDHFPDVRDKLLEQAEETREIEIEHQRLFETRPQKVQRSLTYQPDTRKPLKAHFRRWYRHVFRSDLKTIRYFHKFGMATLRIASVMVIMYQGGFANYGYYFDIVVYAMELIFLVDIFLIFRVGFVDEYGNEVLDRARVRQRYIHSRDGLLMDVLSSIPYEILFLTVPASAPANYPGLTRIYLRLFRIPTRVLRIKSFFAGWLSELDINVLYVRLTYSLAQLVLWMHFFSCVAFFVGDCTVSQYTCDPGTAWIRNTVLNSTNPPATFGQKYVISLYWISNTVTSTGYGDIVAYSNFVRVFAMIVQLVGKCLFGFIIGDISSAMANAEISRQNFESQFQTMKTYLQDQQANPAIIARLQNYFNFLWKVSQGTSDINSLLMDAPYCLRTEIGFAVHNKDLRQLPLFRDSSDAFIRMLSACLHQVQFVPGDYIIQQGDLVQEMYFLHRGMAVEVQTGVELGMIGHRNHINWQAVLIDWPASRTVRATDNCEVYVLSRADLDMTVEKFHDEMELICSATRTRLRDLLEEEHTELD